MATEHIEERDGGYYVAGTRVSLDSIVHAFRRGESPETIRQNFDTLSLEEVNGAITYYLANQPRIDAHLARRERRWERGRSQAKPFPDNLRDLLRRARLAGLVKGPRDLSSRKGFSRG